MPRASRRQPATSSCPRLSHCSRDVAAVGITAPDETAHDTFGIFRRDATGLGDVHPLEPFGLAFLDPPYGKGLAERALVSAQAGNWLKPDALVVVEESADAGFTPPEGFAELERRRYDDTELIFLRPS